MSQKILCIATLSFGIGIKKSRPEERVYDVLSVEKVYGSLNRTLTSENFCCRNNINACWPHQFISTHLTSERYARNLRSCATMQCAGTGSEIIPEQD